MDSCGPPSGRDKIPGRFLAHPSPEQAGRCPVWKLGSRTFFILPVPSPHYPSREHALNRPGPFLVVEALSLSPRLPANTSLVLSGGKDRSQTQVP